MKVVEISVEEKTGKIKTRERIQAFEGVCIGRSGAGLQENFTVRKISYGEGVERVFRCIRRSWTRSRSSAAPRPPREALLPEGPPGQSRPHRRAPGEAGPQAAAAPAAEGEAA